MYYATRSRLRLPCLALLCLLAWTLHPATALAGEKPATKAEKKAILLVTFGTSVASAQKSFQAVEQAVKARFPGVETRWAYTAKMIRRKLADQGQVHLSPAQALANLAEDGYTRVAMQSLHVIPGEEFEGLKETAARFAGMPKGPSRVEVGQPLLAGAEDMLRTAKAMLAHAPKERKAKDALVFMGHGTHHFANAAYPAMAYVFQKLDPNVSLGTVEGYPSLEEVKAELKARGNKKAWLIPFMSVAGDHAMNDMAGEEEDSWKSDLGKAGVSCQPVLTGMAEHPEIAAIWLDHLQEALERLEK